MLFEGNSYSNNNNSERKSVNTKGIDLRNENGFDPCMVTFDFWKSCLSLRMHPVLPADKQTEFKKFDFESNISTALTPQNAWNLLRNIKAVIIPAIQNNEKKFVGVPVGNDGLVGVGSGRTDGSEPYLAIFKGLDQNTKKPESGMCYQFKKNISIQDYDYTTGECNVVETSVMDELELFMEILEEAVKAFTNAKTHSYRSVQDYYNSTLLDLVKQIAQKNGISTGSSSSGYSRTQVFGRNNSSNDELPFADEPVNKVTEEVDNINDLLD